MLRLGRVAGHRKRKRKKSGWERARKKEGFWQEEKIWVEALQGAEKKDGFRTAMALRRADVALDEGE